MHWFPKHGENMDTFRAAVRSALNETNPSSTLPEGIKVGDVVAIKESVDKYYPGGANIPNWVKQDTYHKVTQIVSNGKPVVKGGKPCVLLGKKVDKKSGKESAGIMSWIDVDALTVITNPQKQKVVKYYRVQVGAFSKKENAEELLEKVKKAGFEGYIKQD